MAIRLNNADEDEILAQINIIPLVDVSLVLLIIFIATVSHILTPSIRVKLPQSSHTKSVSPVDSINMAITNEGIIYLDEKIVTLKELKDRLKTLHERSPEQGIVLSVDKSVYFQSVVDALDILSELSITKLDIRTLKQ